MIEQLITKLGKDAANEWHDNIADVALSFHIHGVDVNTMHRVREGIIDQYHIGRDYIRIYWVEASTGRFLRNISLGEYQLLVSLLTSKSNNLAMA